MRAGLSTTLALLVSCSYAGPRIEVRTAPRRMTDVWLCRDGYWSNLTQFPNPTEVVSSDVSPCGQWVYVWHRDWPPLAISIYDSASGHQTARFSPGFGGRLYWTSESTLLHVCGFGTERFFSVYGIDGSTLHEGRAQMFDLAPSHRFAMLDFGYEGGISVLDFKGYKIIFKFQLPYAGSGSNFRWTSDDSAELTVYRDGQEVGRHDLRFRT